jgi:predicted DNA binding CopG/RHH family protein
MRKRGITRSSLAQLSARLARRAGVVRTRPEAPTHELDDAFWREAVVRLPPPGENLHPPAGGSRRARVVQAARPQRASEPDECRLAFLHGGAQEEGPDGMKRKERRKPMKYFDEEERALITAIERADARGELRPVKNQAKAKAEAQAMAKEWMRTERREARINIRLRPSTLAALKARAAVEGLPYQVLVAGLIHRYVFPEPAAGTAPMKAAK